MVFPLIRFTPSVKVCEQGQVGALNLSKLTRTQSAAMVSALAGGKALPVGLLEQDFDADRRCTAVCRG